MRQILRDARIVAGLRDSSESNNGFVLTPGITVIKKAWLVIRRSRVLLVTWLLTEYINRSKLLDILCWEVF